MSHSPARGTKSKHATEDTNCSQKVVYVGYTCILVFCIMDRLNKNDGKSRDEGNRVQRDSTRELMSIYLVLLGPNFNMQIFTFAILVLGRSMMGCDVEAKTRL